MLAKQRQSIGTRSKATLSRRGVVRSNGACLARGRPCTAFPATSIVWLLYVLADYHPERRVWGCSLVGGVCVWGACHMGTAPSAKACVCVDVMDERTTLPQVALSGAITSLHHVNRDNHD